MEKLTYVEALDSVIVTLEDGEVKDKLVALKGQIAKKTSKNSKASKEAEERAEKLYSALAEMDKPVTITELKALTSDEDVAGWNTQRISALFRKLGERVSSEMVKGKRYFAVA